jgi:hypothetical protein
VIELLNTNDRIRLHFLESYLREAGIPTFVFEGGSPWPGAFPARLMVPAEDEDLARRLIAEAEG